MSNVTVRELENDGRRWVELTGTDYGTEYEFDAAIYGVTPDGNILNSDGYPLTAGDCETIAVLNSI